METVEFNVYEEFTQGLADRFTTFLNGLSAPCTVLIDIESRGGEAEVLGEMEQAISAKKAEGFVFVTNVDDYAYSCGLFLFLLGDIKLAGDFARFLYHAAAIEIKNERLTSTDLKEMMEVAASADIIVDRIIAENTKAVPEMLEILKKNENYLSKEDLIYLGFIEREYELI